MWFLWLLSWLAMFFQLVLVTFAVATGLFYLAELVEEYTSTSARIIKYMIYATIAVNVGLLLFEELPMTISVGGIVQQAAHLMLLNSFPYFSFSSPGFVGTCCMIVINHYLAFTYFSTVWHPFSEVLAVFTICLWLVPFAFFVSLSANDNTLPSTMDPRENTGLLKEGNDDLLSTYFNKKTKKVGLLSALKGAQDWIGLSFKSKKTF